MEKRTNNDVMITKALFSPGQMFFFQRWLELLYRHTLDAYQYRILNSHGVLREILDIIESIQKDGVSTVNLTEANAECLLLLQTDVTLTRHADSVRRQLMDHVTQPVKDQASLLRLKYQVTYSLKHIKDYLLWVLEDLKLAIDSDRFNEIESLLTALVSELISRGLPSKSLYNLRPMLERPSKSFEEKWIRFTEILCRRPETFVCVFPADLSSEASLIDVLTWRQAGLTLELGSQLMELYPGLFPQIKDTMYYISCAVTAMDPELALMKAIGEVARPLGSSRKSWNLKVAASSPSLV